MKDRTKELEKKRDVIYNDASCVYILAIIKWNKWRKKVWRNLLECCFMYIYNIYIQISISFCGFITNCRRSNVVSYFFSHSIIHLTSNFFDYHLSLVRYLFNSHIKKEKTYLSNIWKIGTHIVSHILL